MRRRVIAEKLRAVHSEWCESIHDPDVRKLVEKNTIITGGCITSMLLGEEVNDYDVYFTNKETTLAVANYYVNKYRSECIGPIDVLDCGDGKNVDVDLLNGIFDESRIYMLIPSSGISRYEKTSSDVKNKVKYLPKVFTCNAITLDNDIQLIIRFYGDAKRIHENFDFIHATCYWTSSDGEVELPPEALESIVNRQLIYRGSKYPLSSIIRTRKFIQRDWNITGGEYLKMCFQLNQLDLTNVNILSDQLAGVDTTYFMAIIEIIKKTQVDHPKRNIDSHYIGTLVDKFFN